MNLDFVTVKDVLIVIASLLGALGWINALFRVSSENRRDKATAAKSIQEANNLLLSQYKIMLDVKEEEFIALGKIKEAKCLVLQKKYSDLEIEFNQLTFEMVQKDAYILELEELLE